MFLFFLGMQSYVSVTQSEFFPFSWAGLFSGRVTGKFVHISSFVLVTENGEELPYVEWTTIGTSVAYLSRVIDEFRGEDDAVTDEKIKLFSQIVDELIPPHQEFVRKHKNAPRFVEFRIYLDFWESFTGRQLHHPDEHRLLYSRSLQ